MQRFFCAVCHGQIERRGERIFSGVGFQCVPSFFGFDCVVSVGTWLFRDMVVSLWLWPCRVTVKSAGFL